MKEAWFWDSVLQRQLMGGGGRDVPLEKLGAQEDRPGTF